MRGLATILNSTSPIFTFLLTVFLTQHEPVTPRKLFGVIAGIIGICLIVDVEALNGLGRDLWAQLAIVTTTDASRRIAYLWSGNPAFHISAG